MSYKKIKCFILCVMLVSPILASPCYSAVPSKKELLGILNDLRVAPDCVSPKYDRETWKHWVDADKDGQNARHEVLIAESLIDVTLKNNGRSVAKGRWYCPYTDRVFTNPSDLDIDHFVPLSEVHKSGGCHWSEAKKQRYANTLRKKEELIAVDDSINRKKGGKDPAEWMPPNDDYHCEYIANWLIIKDRWDLSVDKKEKRKIESVIKKKCS